MSDKPPAKQILGFSGGGDSTSMALKMAEDGEDFSLFFTPTGNELPDLQAHIERIVAMTGKPLILPGNHSLEHYIETFNALPNNRQRWCTRLIKIDPCKAYLKRNPGTTLCVGLRADEESRVGLYGDFATYRYPLQELGWGKAEVKAYLRQCGIKVPKRTDCAWCPYQRLGEWWGLWRDHKDEWSRGEALERLTGHTFRSPSRDTWPASMEGLRGEFERGRVPRGANQDELEIDEQSCRVCRL